MINHEWYDSMMNHKSHALGVPSIDMITMGSDVGDGFNVSGRIIMLMTSVKTPERNNT